MHRFYLPPQECRADHLALSGSEAHHAADVLRVKAGDHVLFGKWSGTEVRLEGDDLLIMKESDIMGVIA